MGLILNVILTMSALHQKADTCHIGWASEDALLQCMLSRYLHNNGSFSTKGVKVLIIPSNGANTNNVLIIHSNGANTNNVLTIPPNAVNTNNVITIPFNGVDTYNMLTISFKCANTNKVLTIPLNGVKLIIC